MDEVVTAIKVLSPKNKRSGEGQNASESKRQQVLGSSTHLIEIDLLRGGQPMPILDKGIQATYRILVSRSDRRPKAELYPFELQDPILPFQLPLRHGDTEPLVDLQAEQGLIMAINYACEPVYSSRTKSGTLLKSF